MARKYKNYVEAVTGVRFRSVHFWDRHPIVGLSSLCFALPAIAFLGVELCVFCMVPWPYTNQTGVQLILYAVLCACYSSVVVSSWLADYVYIRPGYRSYYGKVDIRLASFTFATSIFDFALRASLLETATLTAIALGAFVFSGTSASLQQWVFRHSLWHLTAGAIGMYGALRLPPEEPRLLGRASVFVLAVLAGFASLILSGLALSLPLGEERRAALWDLGAKHAGWEKATASAADDDLADGGTQGNCEDDRERRLLPGGQAPSC